MTASLATVGDRRYRSAEDREDGLPLFFVTIARSSERKSSADRRAIRGVKDRVAELAKEHKLQAKRHKDEVAHLRRGGKSDPQGQEARSKRQGGQS